MCQLTLTFLLSSQPWRARSSSPRPAARRRTCSRRTARPVRCLDRGVRRTDSRCCSADCLHGAGNPGCTLTVCQSRFSSKCQCSLQSRTHAVPPLAPRAPSHAQPQSSPARRSRRTCTQKHKRPSLGIQVDSLSAAHTSSRASSSIQGLQLFTG